MFILTDEESKSTLPRAIRRAACALQIKRSNHFQVGV
jgi:hypothetical protein